MDFGLGLILSFTDNATAGINSAVNSLNQLTQTAESASSQINQIASLSAFSTIATSMGNSFTSAGSQIIGTLGSIIGKVNETGQTLMFAENQLGKLYEGSDKTGKDVLNSIADYAKKSIFEYEDLIPVVTMLKANGIEAFDSIASSTGKANQTLMDYAADLAAFNPQMRNAYGTGIKAAMGALNEYIAEGNARSLKSGASLDITGLLGEEKGKTIEERSRQVADLMEKLNMVGMTAQLAETPMVKLSNMSDTLFQFLGMIANSGVYDAFNELIDVFAGFVNNIPEKDLAEFASIIGDALATLLVPVKEVAKWIVSLAQAFLDLVKNNPALAKFVTIGTALVGVLLVVSGVALKVAGSLGYLTLMLSQLGGSFSAIGGIMKSGALKILSTFIPLILGMGVLYLAWKNDLFGIRTMITTFVDGVVNSFNTAKTAVSGSLADMQATLKTFDTQNSFFDGLTLAIMRVMVLFKALAEGWNDYTLSEDTFAKAKELGILPLIEAIFNLKYRFDLFKEGFIQGWRNISDKVKEFIQGIVDKADGTIFESLLDGITAFFEKLSSGDAEAWRSFGETCAYVSAGIIALVAGLKTLSTLINVVSKVFGVISKVFGVVQKVVQFIVGIPAKISSIAGAIAHFFSDVIGFFQLVGEFGLRETLIGLFGETATAVSGVASVVGGAILAVINFIDMLNNGFSWLKEILMVVGIALAVVGAIVLGAATWPAIIVGAVVAALATIVVLVKEHWEAIKTFFVGVGNWIYSHVIEPVATFFKNLWQGIVDFLSPVISLIKQMWESFSQTVAHVVERISGFIQELIAGVKSIWDNIMSYLQPAIEQFNELRATFAEFCSFIGSKLSELWTNTISPVLTAIGNFFVAVFQKIWGVIKSVMSAIWNVVQTVWNAIWQFISPVVMAIWNTIQSVFTAIFDTIMNVLSNIWQGIVGVFNGIVTFIGSILGGIWGAISNFFMGIMNFIMGKHDEAKANFSEAWNSIKSIVTGALQGLWQVVTSIFNTIKNVIVSVLNGIKSVVSSVWEGIKSVFSTAGSAISSVVSNTFNAVKNTISNVLNGALNIVKGIVDKIKGAFNFEWKLPTLKLPHVSVTGGEAPFGIAGKGSLPKFSVDWYEQGGVFNKPSVIGVGEAGTEAVMPLENNTEWIGLLANMITSKMDSSIVPTNTSSVVNGGDTSNTNSYMTNTTNNNQSVSGDTDNSVNFGAGAIQITCQNASEEEAMRMAKMILEYIKRQQQLDKMTSYGYA